MNEEDTRILNMRINNKEFLKGSADSVKALDTLNKGIDNAGKGKGLQNMAQSAGLVKTKFGAMQVAGVTALATITNKAVNAGIRMVKSLTIDPILSGFREYEKLLTSTQTVMANTGKSSKEVGVYLDQLNKYSDETIYNFGQMADNVGRFTAAGVKLDVATTAIKGLANAAALGGSTTEQLNTAMYQTSQALSTGVIKLMDFRSLQTAGLGGKNFQNALKATARSLGDQGKAMDTSIKKYGSFNESLRSGWLTADVFTKSMKVFAGQSKLTNKSVDDLRKLGYDKLTSAQIKMGRTVAYSVKQLKGMGYSTEAAKKLNKLSQAAIDSATKIKTFSQLLDVLKEAVGSGFASVFRQLFGNLEQSGKMWTKVGGIITGAIDKIFGSITLMLASWRDKGGFEKFWGGVGNIFKSIGNILRPFFVLFGKLLPAGDDAGSTMYRLTDAFYNFSVWLEKVTSKTSVLSPLFTALGFVLGLIFPIIGAVVGSFVSLVQIFAPLGTALLGLGSSLGEAGNKLLGMIGFGDGISGLFQKFVEIRAMILTPFVDTISAIVDALATLVSGDLSGFKKQFAAAFSNLAPIGDLLAQGKEIASNLIAGLIGGLSSGSILAAISGFVNDMLVFFKGLLGINSPSTVFEGYGRNIVEGLVNGLKSVVGLIGEGISALGDELGKMDKFDVANTISVIFGGAVFLTLRKIFGAFKGFTGDISGLLNQTTATLKSFQNGIRAKALLNIALAVAVLAAALFVLSMIPADKLKVGLAAIAILMASLTVTLLALSKVPFAIMIPVLAASLVLMGVALLILAGAMVVMAKVIEMYAKMKWSVILKGLAMMGVVLLALGVSMTVLSAQAPMMLIASVALIALSIGLTALIGVIKLFAKIKWAELWSGLGKMAAVLVVLGLAMIPLAIMAPGILIASVALVVLGAALITMLGVLAAFAKMDGGTFAKGLGMVAAALIVIGLAALVAAPGLVLLGAAALIMGAGFLMAGIGMTLFGAGLAVVAAAGTAAAAVLIASFEAFLSLLPILGVQLVAALDAILSAFAEKSPSIIDSVVKIGTEMLRGFVELIPEFGKVASALLDELLRILVDARVSIVNAGVSLVVALIQGLADRMPELIASGTDLIVNFITGIGNSAERISTAAFETVTKFLTALDAAIQANVEKIIQTGRSIAFHLIAGLILGLIPEPVQQAFSRFVDKVVTFFKGLLRINSPSVLFEGFGRNLVEGLVKGIVGLIGSAIGAVGRLGAAVIGGIRSIPGKAGSALASFGGILKGIFSRAFGSAVGAVSSGVSRIGSAIGRIPGILRSAISTAGSAAKGIGSAIVQGIKNGLGGAIGAVGDIAGVLMRGIKSGINSALNLPFNIPQLNIKIGPKKFSIGGQQLIPAFARGTTGFGGGSALVGEAGPELVTMNRGSNVITNKSLSGFMKQVAALTKAMTRGSNVQNSPGGKIAYTVGANFQGNPKADGVAFAANITAGLINGLRANQAAVNGTMSGIGSSMSQTFADVLGIQSPSKVFRKYAGYVGQGFINGLLASVTGIQKAARTMGAAAITSISKTITDGQLKLEALRAKADAYANAAEEVRRKAKNKKLSKSQKKSLENQAKKLESEGKRGSKAADSQQKLVEAQNAATDRRQQYAAADTAGKAAMKQEDATNTAQSASAARQKAIQLSKEADLVRKFDKTRSRSLDKLALAQLKRSKVLAANASRYAKDAYKLAAAAKIEASAESMREAADTAANTAAQIQSVSSSEVLKAQAMFDAYTKSFTDAQTAAAVSSPPGDTIFNQNNTSPEAISAADSYRNGKNLLSIMERKLTPVP